MLSIINFLFFRYKQSIIFENNLYLKEDEDFIKDYFTKSKISFAKYLLNYYTSSNNLNF